MNVQKRMIALVLALLVAASLPAFAAGTADAPAQAAFVPVLRFISCSDTHVRDDSDTNMLRIGTMLEEVYAYAEADPNYQRLDALMISGDLTNDGTKTEFDRFAAAVKGGLRGDTQYLGVVAKNHDGYLMKRKELRDYYTQVTGCDADFHKVINGYHFIGLSASPTDGIHYTTEQLNWLRKQLDEAVAAAPDRPVFVTHHEHNRGTVYGSSLYDGWGVTYFNNILKKYPQVVDFSGHSHYPLNDPRSVWQGAFTAIGTGSMNYAEFTVDTTRTYHPADSGEVATYWIVEADAQNRIHLRGMDLAANECLCEYILENPANPENREYTPEKRKAAAAAPAFAPGTQLTVTPEIGGCKVQTPPAQSMDGMPIVLYRVKAKSNLGLTAENWTLPKYYSACPQETIALSLTDLSAGTYTISVTAENAYGMQSPAVEATVTVEGGNAWIHFFRMVGTWFVNGFNIVKNWFE